MARKRKTFGFAPAEHRKRAIYRNRDFREDYALFLNSPSCYSMLHALLRMRGTAGRYSVEREATGKAGRGDRATTSFSRVINVAVGKFQKACMRKGR